MTYSIRSCERDVLRTNLPQSTHGQVFMDANERPLSCLAKDGTQLG
jgi:hypothetical protein